MSLFANYIYPFVFNDFVFVLYQCTLSRVWSKSWI